MKLIYTLFLSAVFSLGPISVGHASNKDLQPTITFQFKNEELSKVIEAYSKASGQKFIVDPSVRGKISIYLLEPITVDEAFNHLSSALAVNGYAMSKQGDTRVIRPARQIQRDLIEVSTAPPPSIKPERMHTWIYKVKNVPARDLQRHGNILSSRDGEMSVDSASNQIVFTDWTSSLNRIAALMNDLDKAADPAVAKFVETGRREKHSTKTEQTKNPKSTTTEE